MTTRQTKKLAVLGFGDIGQRLFRRLGSRYHCTALSRTEKLGPWQWRQTEATDKTSLRHAIGDLDELIISMVPGERSDLGYQQAYVVPIQQLLELAATAARFPKITFVSSTSVMHQNQAEWVDEHSECRPQRFNGQRVYEAEQLLSNSRLDYTIVRFSGIYGPGRERLITRVKQGLGNTATATWSNRIHVDDCAAVLEHLLNMDSHRQTFIASDCCPVVSTDVSDFIRSSLELAEVEPENGPVTEETAGTKEETRGARETGKKCCNKKLLDTGFTFQYPSYREGYSALLSQC
jgi:nucleoside-diphosphate-sugar epimerase